MPRRMGIEMKLIWLMATIVIALFWTNPVHASGDSTCYPDWKVKHTDRNMCSSTALLSPGNDTRVNLLMLLHDRHGSVGPASKYRSSTTEPRGDAEPFSYPLFALALGPAPAGVENDETGNFPFGTRCMSNMAAGADFIQALNKAKNIPQAERATLASVRTTLKPECLEATEARSSIEPAVGIVKSKQGTMFGRYLVGAAAFYDGDFVAAKTIFAGIEKSDVPWLNEAVSYMRGRVAVNAALAEAFDEYGSLADKTDAGSLAEAEAGFLGYLKAYPDGQYSVSARGLLRRVYWMGKKTDKLIAEYVAQFAQTDAAKRNVSLPDLVQEIDIKLLDGLKPGDVTDPMLLAVLDLKAMRHSGDPKMADYDGAPITRDALAAQRSRFAGNEALFGYVLAVHAFYVANDAADVLRLIPAADINASSSYLNHSRQLLRALALDAQRDASAGIELARIMAAAKQPFQRGTAELALALHEERDGGMERVFAANSPITDADVREILLRYHAGPALLRKQATKAASETEQKVALFTLLYKSLTRGSYNDFLRDLKMVPANARPTSPDEYRDPVYTDISLFRWQGSTGFVCPSLKAVATTLSVKRKDAQSLLCLGDFIRISGFDPDFYGVTEQLDDLPDADELGGSPSMFPGKRFSRLEGYRAVIADPTAGATNKAYALYRAVNCYAPSAYNGCDETEVPVSQRKGWFQKLKSEYPASPWAKKLVYYW